MVTNSENLDDKLDAVKVVYKALFPLNVAGRNFVLDSETFMQPCPDQGRHDNGSGLG
jgi:hypothetical protein